MSCSTHPIESGLRSGTANLVDLLLAEQQSLCAVERFAQEHESAATPIQERHYRDLIPGRSPGPGQQYAFQVDLDRCTGCKACVTACHNLNGLDEDETWRDVGLMIGGTSATPVRQTVTTACHHCEDPGCLAGCPVMAYEKDPKTGIVRHLDDQCIGCQYCVLKCPYDVPKYDASRGIVRKCDLCTDRLAADEAPACVQGCPSEAISIEIVEVGDAHEFPMLPVAAECIPDSSLTRPTTRYTTSRSDLEALRPADANQLSAKKPHWPLVWMLVLVQLSTGIFLFDALAHIPIRSADFGGTIDSIRPVWALAGTLLALLGQGAATFHLGRPQYAWRALLGWRTSWMSREIAVLGAFAGVASLYTASLFFRDQIPGVFTSPALSLLVVAVGILGTFCSAMIYADTGRPFWSLRRSTVRFFASVWLLGAPALLVLSLVATSGSEDWVRVGVPLLCLATLIGSAFKLAVEAIFLRHRRPDAPLALHRSARLLSGELRSLTTARFAAGVVGGIAIPIGLINAQLLGADWSLLVLAGAMLALTFVSELLERHLFFIAEAMPAMPGH